MDAFRKAAALSPEHLRAIAIRQLGLREEEVTADCIVTKEAAQRKGWPVHEEQPADLVAPEADILNVPLDVISVEDSEVDNASTASLSDHSENSCSSSTSSSSSTSEEPARSEASVNHKMMSQAYDMTRNQFEVHKGVLTGGIATLNVMDLYPMQWPLAKLKIPIDHLIQRVERLLTGYANEISATQWYPDTFYGMLKSSAKHLTERILQAPPDI